MRKCNSLSFPKISCDYLLVFVETKNVCLSKSLETLVNKLAIDYCGSDSLSPCYVSPNKKECLECYLNLLFYTRECPKYDSFEMTY